MRTVLYVQEIRGRTGNQQQARIDMPLWFGYAVSGIRNCASVEAELILIETGLERAQRHRPETVGILRHLGGCGPLGFVDTALNADRDLHVVRLWC